MADKSFVDEYDVKLEYEISDDKGEARMTKGMSYILITKSMRNNLATAAIEAWTFMKMCQEDYTSDYVTDRIPEESTKIVFFSHKFPSIRAEEVTWDSESGRISVEDEKQKVIKCCSSKDMEKLWIAYDKCAFGQWKDEYYEPVLDGETWQLEFYGRGVCVRQIVGSNGYPEKWKDFLYFINLCKKIAKKKD